MTRKITLSKEKIKIITDNYGLMTNAKLCKLVNITAHTLMKNVESFNIEQNINLKEIEDFDDGNGFFDIDKYKKFVL